MTVASGRPGAHGVLATALTALAGTPDHSPTLDGRMLAIAKLTAERVGPALYASITALRGKVYTTVAVSDDLIQAVDHAQYSDNAGPCLDSVNGGVPVGVPDIDAMVQWPGFHEVAPRMGLHASVSVPMFAGRGKVIAALNAYGHDRAAMAPLIAGIWHVHGRAGREGRDLPSGLDAGGLDLVTGYAAALDIRATIRHAIKLIATANRCGADDAYLSLCLEAGTAGTDLTEAALAVIRRMSDQR
ncbi:GAF domain-containing protein [Paractinoplanes maris]|uniref:GAF domain-containing protein n=1 Tax=Paractinoplanes maris TaxID=1734446 RepID=UPI0020222F55|nr:GAF domain-containing protein [Actinoplanes maris]